MSPHATEHAALREASYDFNSSTAVDTLTTKIPAKTFESDAAVSCHLRRASEDEQFDLVCVGFGPANLAFAIAIHDAIEARPPLPGLSSLNKQPPKVLFLERQRQFGWHTGMLLPGSRMQITFVKDLATFRNPRSEFTFLNYLHKKNRLATFTNLGTFLPSRLEYEDYMKWCAAAFDEVVDYGSEVFDISPEFAPNDHINRTIHRFSIKVKDLATSKSRIVLSKKVVIAMGGKPSIPATIPESSPRILHSSQYATSIHKALPDHTAAYTIGVVGCGQSAAEIFKDLHNRFPNSKTRLLVRGSALKPSDDSPFVNEIFDPERVDSFYQKPADQRQASIEEDRSTNYSVVRISLLEELYEQLYMQRLKSSNSKDWQHQILTHRTVVDAKDVKGIVKMGLMNLSVGVRGSRNTESLDLDAVVFATGYTRDSHEALLNGISPYRAKNIEQRKEWTVQRDYKACLDKDRVKQGVGIWLLGCNEGTHGLSDTLLSVLATRGGELTKSIFAD